MEPESYTLQLNRTHLLFMPPLDLAYDPNSTSGTVVQVCLRGDHGDGYMRCGPFGKRRLLIPVQKFNQYILRRASIRNGECSGEVNMSVDQTLSEDNRNAARWSCKRIAQAA